MDLAQDVHSEPLFLRLVGLAFPSCKHSLKRPTRRYGKRRLGNA